MSAPSAAVLTAKHVLHLNLNTTDIEASSRFYCELLGLDLRMQSEGDDGDWRFHGIAEPVSSAGWFLYDDRGPRTSPALELVQWRRPATAGTAYPDLVHRGLTAVVFTVPAPQDLSLQVAAAGGAVVGPLGDGGLLVRDPDGVHVELMPPQDATETARLRTARIGCSDLDASLAWYAQLGFAQTSEPVDRELPAAGRTLRLRSARVALASRAVELELTQWLDPVAEQPAEGRLWYRGMVRMAISVEDLDEAIAAIVDAGLPCPEPQFFGMPGTAVGGLRVLFLTDPDGFTVELVHRPSQHFTPAAPGPAA